MPEPFTFLAALSAAPATLKFAYDSVDFYSQVKALRSPAPRRPLTESEFLNKLDRNELNKMYMAVERCRPVAADIAARALRFYLVVAGGVIAILVLSPVLLIWIRPFGWLLSCAGVIAVVGPIIIKALPAPIPKVKPILNDKRFKSGSEIVASLASVWRDGASVWWRRAACAFTASNSKDTSSLPSDRCRFVTSTGRGSKPVCRK